MTWRATFHMAVGFVFLSMLLAVKPAWADQELDAQIKALEKEVAKIEPLKDQLEKLKEQQIELKKEATAAAAAETPKRSSSAVGRSRCWIR